MERLVHGHEVRGVGVGPETRCSHYGSDRDVVAIRFACCGTYYPCIRCHRELADHPGQRWPRDSFDRPAVLCGVCGHELAVSEYLAADDRCPDCEASFNPGCREHRHHYFAVE